MMKSQSELIAKIEKFREKGGVDLSNAEDLSIAVMNLISLEEHFYFTGKKTGKDEYFDAASEIREMRKELLASLMPEHEGETWCASKHLLSGTMRLIETGNKLHSAGKKDEAKGMYDKAYKMYSIFWALKLKLVGVRDGVQSKSDPKSKKVEDLLNELANCCDE